MEQLEEREREIYGDEEMDDALDDGQRRRLRLSDDGELVQFDSADEDGEMERDRRA